MIINFTEYKYRKENHKSMVDKSNLIIETTKPIQEDKDHSFPSYIKGTIGGIRNEN